MGKAGQVSPRYGDGRKIRFHGEVGRMIAKCRSDGGFSQVQLAAAVGVGHNTIANVESGQTPCPLWLLVQIADALDANLYDLVPVDDDVPA